MCDPVRVHATACPTEELECSRMPGRQGKTCTDRGELPEGEPGRLSRAMGGR